MQELADFPQKTFAKLEPATGKTLGVVIRPQSLDHL